MLLQHHVEGLVAPRIPEDWEEEVQHEAERPRREPRQTRQLKSREVEDLTEATIPKLSEQPDDFLVNGVLPVYDDSEDEDYVPE